VSGTFRRLQYDQDQRDNVVNAKRQQVQILFARLQQAGSWFSPELLKVPLESVRGWMDASSRCGSIAWRSRTSIGSRSTCSTRRASGSCRSRAPVRRAERGLLALSTADAKFPTITLSSGDRSPFSYVSVPRESWRRAARQARRAAAFSALHETYQSSIKHYATLYNGVCPARLVPGARARATNPRSEAALHGDNIPTSVVENLIRDDARRRRAVAPGTIACVARRSACRRTTCTTSRSRSSRSRRIIITTSARLDRAGGSRRSGPEYQARMREGFQAGGVDVYENEGKRSGAYSGARVRHAPVHVLNYTDTPGRRYSPLAHEMGHSMHTILSHEHQPFVYSSYTIFVAEVPSTLNEALLLEYMLAHSKESGRARRAAPACDRQHHGDLLHAGDVCRLRAARAPARRGGPADHVGDPHETYRTLLKDYYGDAVDLNGLTGLTWARIPHFFTRRTTSTSTRPASRRRPHLARDHGGQPRRPRRRA